MSIVLEQLTKRYQGHSVVHDLSLEIADGELFVLLGPSGSGKSTVLRMIAGLAEADTGRILLHGRDVTRLPASKRGVGFVFQSYALFRGMSVAENIEFALSIRKVGRSERRRRRDELLELVGLAGLGGRMPRQLSGGQQQRVALARALAHEPEVLLLDEPFGALDARIRTELRRTIRGIQRELKIATIFVTHDQEEAFELADRLAVLNFGRLLEAGPPQELYLRPQTEFVATFLGSANLMVGEHTRAGVRLGPVEFPLATESGSAVAPEGSSERRRVQVLFRPEDVAVKESEEALGYPLLGKAIVEQTSLVGAAERLRLRLPPLAGVRPIAPDVPFGSEHVLIDAVRSQHQAYRYPLRPGDTAWVGVRRIHALVHPGLSLLLASDGSEAARTATDLGGRIARMAHARVTVLASSTDREERAPRRPTPSQGFDERLQEEKERLGSGLASIEAIASPLALASALAEQAERRPVDLVVLGLPARGAIERAERALAAGGHHLLAVPESASPELPTHFLICVAVGEPGKADVLFAGRLARHLGATATVLTVLPAEAMAADAALAQRFLAASVRSLGRIGVAAEVSIRRGDARTEILAAAAVGEGEGEGSEPGKRTLLVIGAPLARERRAIELEGLVGDLIESANRPLLIIRSGAAMP
ncbi:MAG TPA: ATP-binding cassette domain-containing protein [Thermoanaerobaculia bacterium]|jgi:sulfate transport system ATP-binding protein|nr:ATP-binding cassette domain-containing protein [Thermoanaerobaculia bacterium]